nr:Short-chain dehydrogenase reductase SDR domain containing protein [Haemonchus contortus]
MFWWFLLGLVPPICYIIARYIWESFEIEDLSSKAVLITGCDSGFGRELALRCVQKGFIVFAGCLTNKGEISLRSECSSPKLRTIPLDVASDESVEAARRVVDEYVNQGHELWGIVNNAGIFSCYGPDDWTRVEDYVHAAQVNTFGVVRVVHALKKYVKRSAGRIVTVTSVNGRFSTPCGGPYVVSKYGTEAYMDAIRQELYVNDVKVSILEPGIFRTPLIDEQAMIQRIESAWSKLDDETKEEYGEYYKTYFAKLWNELFLTMSSTKTHYVVDNYMHALTALYPRHRYYCGWDAILLWVPLSILPTWLSDFMMRSISRQERYPAAIEKKMRQQKKLASN